MYLEINNKIFGKLKLIPLNSNSEDDFETFKEIMCNPIIMKTASIFNREVTREEDVLKKYFNLMTKSNETHNIGVGKIIDKNNTLIGISGFGVVKNDENNNPEIVELIYFLKQCYWNKKIGYNTSVVLMEYLFNNFNSVKEVLGISLFDNYPSQIIMLKLGFKFVKAYSKRGAIINYHTLNKEIYLNNILKDKKYYIKVLNNINKTNRVGLDEIENFVI